MTVVTLHASVICKWFLQDADKEDDQSPAKALREQVESRAVRVLQPAHTVAEVLAVLSRRRPQQAVDATAALVGAALPVWETAATYRTALTLAVETRAHVFDTLYHALALELDGTLITADVRCYRSARVQGRIKLLRDWFT